MNIDTLSNDLLVHIITIVLKTNPWAVHRLAINHHIWHLADKHWPEILRGLLKSMIITTDNATTDLAAACQAIYFRMYGPSNVICGIELLHKCDNTAINTVFRIRTDASEIGIVLYNCLVIFVKGPHKYEPLLYQRYMINPYSDSSQKYIVQSIQHANDKITLLHKIKQLMSKILPELLDMFDFSHRSQQIRAL